MPLASIKCVHLALIDLVALLASNSAAADPSFFKLSRYRARNRHAAHLGHYGKSATAASIASSIDVTL